MERRAQRRAELVYGAIDRSDGFFHGPVATTARSLMNVVFRLPTAEQDRQFVAGAAERGIVGLAGHRSVGGIRGQPLQRSPGGGGRAPGRLDGGVQGRRQQGVIIPFVAYLATSAAASVLSERSTGR